MNDPHSRRDAGPGDRRDALILMVDDEPTTLEVMALLLRADGYRRVDCVSDSRLVLDRIEREAPAILLLNLMMPHVDGLELLDHIRGQEHLRNVPVVIVTGSTDPSAKRSALEHGATDFLAKPVDPSELLLRVRNILTATAGLPIQPRKHDDPILAPAEAEGSTVRAEGPLRSRLLGSHPNSGTIVAAFAGRLRARLAEMESSLESRAFEELEEHAHWLRGAGGTVGFDEFTEPADALRMMARNRKPDAIEPLLETLNRLADRIEIAGEDT
ncbi:MAG: response regulator [Myxococcota bacterium]|nr:response regulator [Myxococcota bacterium]